MTTLTISLPDSLKEFVDAKVAEGGHADAVGYVRSLIEKERERAERLEFEESLREAMRGPATVMTPEDWEEIRREGQRLIAERKAR